jgi:predicted HicB family RNase H-like nuclease
MAKKADYADTVQGFKERYKAEPVQLSIQKVTPIQPAIEPKEERQLNVWIPKSLMKRLKARGAETDESLKEMVIKALEQFL